MIGDDGVLVHVRASSVNAGQTKDGLILFHQLRTIDLQPVTSYEIGGRKQFITDPGVPRNVRLALLHQLGLDLLATLEGAAP